jgi:hypothetical protein
MRHTNTHKQTIRLVTGVFYRANIIPKESEAAKLQWEKSVVDVSATTKINNNIYHIFVYVHENKNLQNNYKNKTRIIIYSPNSNYSYQKEFFANQYETVEQYLSAIKEGLINALNSLNTLNV